MLNAYLVLVNKDNTVQVRTVEKDVEPENLGYELETNYSNENDIRNIFRSNVSFNRVRNGAFETNFLEKQDLNFKSLNEFYDSIEDEDPYIYVYKDNKWFQTPNHFDVAEKIGQRLNLYKIGLLN